MVLQLMICTYLELVVCRLAIMSALRCLCQLLHLICFIVGDSRSDEGITRG